MKGVKGESGTVDARVGTVHRTQLERTGKGFLIGTGQESVEKWH